MEVIENLRKDDAYRIYQHFHTSFTDDRKALHWAELWYMSYVSKQHFQMAGAIAVETIVWLYEEGEGESDDAMKWRARAERHSREDLYTPKMKPWWELVSYLFTQMRKLGRLRLGSWSHRPKQKR